MSKDPKTPKKVSSAEQQRQQIEEQRKRLEDMTREVQKQSAQIAKLIFPSDEDNEDEVVEEGIIFGKIKLKAKL